MCQQNYTLRLRTQQVASLPLVVLLASMLEQSMPCCHFRAHSLASELILATLAPSVVAILLVDKHKLSSKGVLTVSPCAHELIQHRSHLRLGRHV